MVEKVRVSLWDIFTFFLTGLLATVVALLFLIAQTVVSVEVVLKAVASLPAAVSLFIAPLLFTLLGMLIEPLANYADRYIFRYLLWWVARPKDKHSSEEILLRDEIRASYLGSLSGRLDNPYALCKEYVETKQLSTTFMVFLSRYGFYRNCSFIAVVSGVVAFLLASTFLEGAAIFSACFALAAVFKRRAEDFYSYMAPSIYRAFLIDRLDWGMPEGASISLKRTDQSLRD